MPSLRDVAHDGVLCTFSYRSAPQSTELTSGPPELVQHFRLWREFTMAQERRMSYNKFDMVWLNHSPIPVGRRGGYFLVQMISTWLPSRSDGGGVGTLWAASDQDKWCCPSGQAAWTVHHVQNPTLLGHSPPASQAASRVGPAL
jgi:hypothetical protein